MADTMPLFAGCTYVVGKGHKGKDPFKIFCNKACAPGSSYCPKHDLITEDEGREPDHRRQKRKSIRQRQEDEATALAFSPLRATNPKFDTVKTYTEPE